VLLGMADEAMKQKILARLTSEEMWTSYGSRTVSEAEANFDPDAGYQLLGGLWTNLTAWIAYCLRDVNPEKLVEGMHNIFRLPEEERPVDWGNVVPGEFPERLHGTTAKSRGMTMSPWLPPTYFWLGIEGLFGFTPDLHRPSVNPSMPNGWTWMAVSNLFWQGQKYSFLVHEGELYANCEVDSTLVVHEVSFLSVTVEEGDVFALAFMEGDVAVLFAGADVPAEAVLSIVCGQRTYRHTVSLKHGECSLIRFVPNEV